MTISQVDLVNIAVIKEKTRKALDVHYTTLMLPRAFSRSQYSNEQSSFAKLKN